METGNGIRKSDVQLPLIRLPSTDMSVAHRRRVQSGLRKYGYRERPKFYDFLHEPASPDRRVQRLRLEAPLLGLLLSPLLRRPKKDEEQQGPQKKSSI